MLKISNAGDNFFVDFNASKVRVGFQVLIVIVQEHWRVVHRREADRWNANAANIATISSAWKDFDTSLQSTEITNFELIRARISQGRKSL